MVALALSTTSAFVAGSGCCTASPSSPSPPCSSSVRHRGSRRWIELGIFPFQPSELAIVLLTVTLAAFLVDRLDSSAPRRMTLTVLVLAAAGGAGLPAARPRHGDGPRDRRAGAAVLLRHAVDPLRRHPGRARGGRGRARARGMPALGGTPSCKSYQLDRLSVFLDPSHDPSASGYNITQSLIAVGAAALPGAAPRPRRRRWSSCPNTTPISSSPSSASAGGFWARPAARALRPADLAGAAHHRHLARHVRQRHRRRHRAGLPVRGPGECGHDTRYHADHGHPAAVRQLWRRGPGHRPDAGGPAREHPRAEAGSAGRGGEGHRRRTGPKLSVLRAQVAEVRSHPGDGAHLPRRHRRDLLADAAGMLSAGADDAHGGVAAALDVLDPPSFPTRPEALSRWSVDVFLRRRAGAASGPSPRPPCVLRAARLPAIVAAVRDTEAVAVDRHAFDDAAPASRKEFVLHARGTPAPKSALARRIAAGRRRRRPRPGAPPACPARRRDQATRSTRRTPKRRRRRGRLPAGRRHAGHDHEPGARWCCGSAPPTVKRPPCSARQRCWRDRSGVGMGLLARRP